MATTVAGNELHSPADAGTSLRNQAWLMGVSRRWAWLAAGLLFILFLLALYEDAGSSLTPLAGVLSLPAAAIWALMVWYDERPSRRSYHWSLPVARPVHDLARVAVGAAYLLFVWAILAAAGALVQAAGGTLADLTAMEPKVWLGFFAAPLALYLLTMPLVLWSEYRITKWFLVGLIAFTQLALALELLGWPALGHVMEWIFSSEGRGMATALLGWITADADWASAIAVWLILGAGLTTVTAVWRPDDFARAVRG